MTIALGILSDEGVVIGADSEYTGAIKLPGTKVWRIAADEKKPKIVCGLAGAGDAVLLTAAKDRIAASPLLGRIRRQDELVDLVESQLIGLHQKHIYPNPAFGPQNPALNLVLGVSDGKSVALYETASTTVARSQRYVCVGYGSTLGHYLMESLDDGFPVEGWSKAIALAAYVLNQTKRYSPFCGGESHIMWISPNGEVTTVSQELVAEMEREFNEAPEFPRVAVTLSAARAFLLSKQPRPAGTYPRLMPEAAQSVPPRSKRAKRAQLPSQE